MDGSDPQKIFAHIGNLAKGFAEKSEIYYSKIFESECEIYDHKRK